jgi:hypothetical protein
VLGHRSEAGILHHRRTRGWLACGTPDRQPLRLPAALREYLREEAAGGIVLMAAAAVAPGVGQPPWRAAYDALWATPLGFQLGRYALYIDLRHWVNEGLMALFFLVVGLAFPPGRFDAAVKLGCCSPRCSPAPAARWCCWPVGANGALDALDEFCAVPLPFAAR